MGKIKLLILLIVLSTFIFPQKANAEKESGSSAAFMEKNIVKEDKRAKILKNFLEKYNSPLAQYSDVFVKSADANRIDWRMVAAISGVESTFGQELPYNSYNAWGWGIYGNNMIYFSSYDEAIKTISKALRERYIDSWGAQDVYQIGRFYAASPTWSYRVAYFMDKIENESNGPSSLSLTL